jgi:hypothetical protein
MEAQMTLHGHPLNAAREAAGQRPINSVWFWGCGAMPTRALPASLSLDASLRSTWIQGDWAGWAEAWRAIDDQHLRPLLPRLRDGSATLSLAGERRCVTLRPRATGWTERIRQVLRPARGQARLLLETL